MLAYALKLFTRARLKEINLHLLLGPPHRARRTGAGDRQLRRADLMRLNTLPGALRQIEEDRAAGRRLVLATASYRLYVEAIAAKLGFDDVIATNSILGIDARVTAKIDGENCYGPAKLRMIEAWFAGRGDRPQQGACALLFGPRVRRAGDGMGRRGLRHQSLDQDAQARQPARLADPRLGLLT